MAYGLDCRFGRKTECIQLLDPGAYQNDICKAINPNKAPFLSSSKRDTNMSPQLWTQAVYNSYIPPRIIGCTSMRSKVKRFPYESWTEEDLKELLCRCGLPCECAEEEEDSEVLCQAKVPRRLYKGPPPHSALGEGISAPSKRHRGFELLSDGSTKQLQQEILDECPPFYDTRVNEATSFYHGCKWSQWKEQRSLKSLESRPGPADYDIEKHATDAEICAEKIHEEKRRTSKQIRYIEMIIQRNTLDGLPGPSDYTPQPYKGTELTYLGPKEERFPSSQYDVRPDPTTYHVRRDFDPTVEPDSKCHAKLPEPACFGNKADRFKPLVSDGPSPATYYPNTKLGIFLHCGTAPFGTSTKRFEEIDEVASEFDESDKDDNDEIFALEEVETEPACPELMWPFRSKTVRMKPLKKKLDEPSPADFPQQNLKAERTAQLQYLAPFNTSEGRFQPWHDWLPVHCKFKTPGPCYYNAEKPKCMPAVNRGPLFRSRRFPSSQTVTPAPNEYTVGQGMETVLSTHNQRLKNNIENQHHFKWKPKPKPRKLTRKEQEMILLEKTIRLLDLPGEESTESEPHLILKKTTKSEDNVVNEKDEQKILKCFLYSKPCETYF